MYLEMRGGKKCLHMNKRVYFRTQCISLIRLSLKCYKRMLSNSSSIIMYTFLANVPANLQTVKTQIDSIHFSCLRSILFCFNSKGPTNFAHRAQSKSSCSHFATLQSKQYSPQYWSSSTHEVTHSTLSFFPSIHPSSPSRPLQLALLHPFPRQIFIVLSLQWPHWILSQYWQVIHEGSQVRQKISSHDVLRTIW